MLIAFEGPYRKGTATAADRLSGGNTAELVTDAQHQVYQQHDLDNPGTVQCFDRIGWFSHLAHSLCITDETSAGPSALHSVFTMPDTHLVFKLYRRGEESPNDAGLNQVYTSLAHTFMAMNEARDFSLFKTVTITETYTDPLDGTERMEVMEFSSPLQNPWWLTTKARLVQDDLGLFDMLSVEDAQL